MASASLKPIYERMNGISNYHPYTADTFADWSLEAGDIVTVSQDGNEYQSPVHKTTVRWTGKQQIELESNGEKERAPLSKMSADAYNYGNGGANGYRGGYRSGKRDQDFYTDIRNNRLAIELEAVDRREADNNMEALISVTASEIKAEVKNYTDDKSRELGARLDVQARLIDMVVYEDKDGKHIRSGQIALAINTGGSEAIINANRIRLEGTTKLNDVMTVSNGSVHISKPLIVDGAYADFNEIRIHNSRFSITDVVGDGMIKSASVSGNVLTLTKFNGDKINFSKATTLRGVWSGENRTWTVTASPQNEKDIIQIGTVDRNTVGISRVGSDSWIGRFEHGQYDAGYADGYRDASGGQYQNSITLEYDHVSTSQAGGVTVFTYYYKYSRNSAYRPMGDIQTVWW